MPGLSGGRCCEEEGRGMGTDTEGIKEGRSIGWMVDFRSRRWETPFCDADLGG